MIALGLASLIHQFNFVMLACGMAGLAVFGSAAVRRRLLRLAVWTTIVSTVGFTMLGALSLPTHSPLRIVKWIVGYGGDPTYGRSFGLRGLAPALYSVAETFLRDPYLPGPRLLWSAVVLIGILLFLAGLARLRRLPSDERPLLAATSLQLLVGWSLIVWWWPLMYGKWWILTLPMMVIWWDRALAGLTASFSLRAPQAAPRIAGAALAAPLVTGAFLLVFNFVVALDGERRPDAAFERSLAEWVARSAPDDLLIENGRLTAHLIFWSHRPNAMNVYRVLQVGFRAGDPLGAVRRLIDTAIRDGHQVLFGGGLDPYFFTDDLLGLVGTNRRELERCFDAYRHEGPVFSYQEWPASPPTPVFRLLLPAGRP